MRRRYFSLAIGFLCLVVLGLAVWPGAAGQAVPGEIAVSKQLPAPRTLGVATCASMACHGSTNGGKGGEYATWIAVDWHAKAYRALFNPESKRMHENLARYTPAYKAFAGAHENSLCLKCHAMGPGGAKDQQADGVGCERCHGPAEHWKTTHYLNGFDRSTPGFHDLRDLEARARTCVKCHVGDADQEVNHDLIAAGHPRLRFEFAAYHANYPKHWDYRAEKANDPGFEVRAWAVGQLVSAESALKLLVSRTKDKDPITGEKKPWPEFAEYECAACHHGLAKPSFRQERDAKRAAELFAKGKEFRSGELPWGTWYYPLLPLLGDRLSEGDVKDLQALQQDLETNLRKRSPLPASVATKATREAQMLNRWLAQVKKEDFDRKHALALFAALSREKSLADRWDSAAQVYLGLAATYNALGDLDPTFAERSPLKGPLLEMRNDLREAFDKDATPLYDSPRKYDPKALRKALGEIQGLLK